MSKGKIIGYIRVSSFDQNPERQLEGITIDKSFSDKASGKNMLRPQLEAMLDYVRDGDTVVVHSMDRLARNLDDLRKIVTHLTKKQVEVRFVKENLTFTGQDSPMSVLLLSIMGAFSEFERSLIRERQMEGIAIAQKKGVYKGRKKKLNEGDVCIIYQRLAAGEKKSQIAKSFGICRDTLYEYINKKNGLNLSENSATIMVDTNI